MRWWLSFVVLFTVLVGGVFAGLRWLGWFPVPGTAAVAIFYIYAVVLNLLPPGPMRPSRKGGPAHAGPASGTMTRAPRGFVEERYEFRPLLLTVTVAAFAGLAVLAALRLTGSSDTTAAGAGDLVPASVTAAGRPPAAPTTPSPTLPAPATATAAPPTATPAPPTATAPPPGAAASGLASLTGQWTIVDTVAAGRNRGQWFRFTVTLQESNGQLTGTGGGLTLKGVRVGTIVELAFAQGSESGTFQWALRPDGTLSGLFSDDAGTSGTCIATRQQ